jgi:hypothetical protein
LASDTECFTGVQKACPTAGSPASGEVREPFSFQKAAVAIKGERLALLRLSTRAAI